MRGHSTGLEDSRYRRVTVPRCRAIYDEGEPATAFYRVETGCMRLQVNGFDGRRKILSFCLPGDFFGIDLDTPRLVAAEAAVHSELTRFPTLPIAGEEIGSARLGALLTAASDVISSLSAHLKGLGQSGGQERVAWFIDWLALRQDVGPSGGIVEIPMSRRDVADFLGLAPETLSRIFAQLQEEGRVQIISRSEVRLRRPEQIPHSVRTLEHGAA